MANATMTPSTKRFSKSYYDSFGAVFNGGDKTLALTEGALVTGGFAVPYRVADVIVPLGPQDSAVRRLATVIETEGDLHYPVAINPATAAAKAEAGPFTGVFPVSKLGGFTLSAFVVGVEETISFEASQDVPALRAYLEGESLFAVDAFEEAKFIHGSGVSEPQGLLGNVGAGVTAAAPDAAGNLLSINATYDVLDTLQDVFHTGASWLMSRTTASALRKAQNSNDIIFSRDGGRDTLHGYPVEYSAAMPAIAAGSTPILFGNFAVCMLVGDRGGSGLNVKLLDQLMAAAGLYQFLAFRRVDSRIRRPESVQSITLHS